MKITSTLLTVFFLHILSPVVSQQIIGLEIRKPLQENDDQRTRVSIVAPMDLTNFDINNPIDQKLTKVTVFKDETGKDLLEGHQKAIARIGYNPPIIDYYGVADYQNNKDIELSIEVLSSPANNAQEIHVEGKIFLNFIEPDDSKTIKLKSIPVESSYDAVGVETKIGIVKMRATGTVTVEEVSYELYQVIAEDVTITSVEVTKGPGVEAREELKKLNVGVEGNEIPLKGEMPETVDIMVTYSSIKKVEVPLVLDFSVGL